MQTQVPGGVNDFLPGALTRKRAVEDTVRRRFSLWGYDEVAPAGLDYYDRFAKGTAARRQEDMLKTFDAQGRILVLRPEFTTPLARLASTKLRALPPPLRLCYLGTAYENPAGHAGRLAEFTQAGVELLGEAGPQADAEVVALALECMGEAGLAHYLIEIGQVDFFKGLMEEAGLDGPAIAALRTQVEEKNLLGMELTLRDARVGAEVAERIMRLPMLFGGPQVLAEAAKLSSHPRCVAALDNLNAIYALLKGCGLTGHLSIDLGMVHSIGYYTGAIFRGMTSSFGQPLLSGGRYDTLLTDFGRPLPATGFAMGIEHVLSALDRQGEETEGGGVDILLALDPGMLPQAWPKLCTWRAEGLRVELCYALEEAAIAQRAQSRRAGRVIRFGQEEKA